MKPEHRLITFKHRNGELTLLVKWDGEEGSVVSFFDYHKSDRAFYDSYDMKEFSTYEEFERYCSKYEKKARVNGMKRVNALSPEYSKENKFIIEGNDMKYLVIRVMKECLGTYVWSTWDNPQQAGHDCQLIHNDAFTSHAFVALATDFEPSDEDKR